MSGALVGVGIAPTSAQYYPPDPGDETPPPYYQPQYPQPQPQPYYPQPGYEPNPYPHGGPYGRRYGPPRAGGVGYHCATGRGLCETGYPAPLHSPCRCDFGYERKRGVVVP